MKNLKKIIFSKYEEKLINQKNENIFYAGYWASDSIDLKKHIDYLSCIWSSEKDKNQSYKNLKNIYDKYLVILTNFFNKYHNVNHDKKYWEIISGIWLNTYLNTLYYRWSVVKKISNKKKNNN